ncbi:MAG TPA: hypothetical protein VG388_09675 [Solirubrobacteraceae bacterium]|jgi:hypothetical protein|nr:hypothetical protein [Solirubrobacteraceae bacterium]
MPTAAERIYEAAAAALAAQQARADQITNQMGPIGAGAAAAALLLKPAAHDLSHAAVPQAAGFAAGVFGLCLVLLAGVAVLSGVTIKGVEAVELANLGAGPGDLIHSPETFDLEAATRLGASRTDNATGLRTLRRRFFAVVAGLLLEVAGLALAAELAPASSPRSPGQAMVRVTVARMSASGLTLAGRLAPVTSGRVRVTVTLHGRGAKTIARGAPLTGGRFALRIGASRRLRPLRYATYTVAWSGSPRASAAAFSGTVTRGPTR